MRLLSGVLTHRADAFIVALLIGASIMYPYKRMKKTVRQHHNINDIRIRVRVPRTNRLKDTEAMVEKYEDFLYGNSERYDLKSVIARFGDRWAYIHAFLNPPPEIVWWKAVYRNFMRKIGHPVDRRLSRQDVMTDVQKHAPKFPGVKAEVRGRTKRESTGVGVSIELQGKETRVLEGLAQEVERRLENLPGMISVRNDMERGRDEIRVKVDRTQAKKYGVSPQTVAGTIGHFFRSTHITDFRTSEREIGVYMYPQKEEEEESLLQVKKLAVMSDEGVEIPINALATFSIGKGPSWIHRRDGRTVIRVSGVSTAPDLSTLYDQVDDVLADLDMPRGYTWTKGQRYRRYEEADRTFWITVALAVTLVFLLMGILFESVILPLSIFLAIPFSFLGVYWVLYLTKTPMDHMARIGTIILIGVVVNNAIVMVDMVNRLRARGIDRMAAILDAGRHRLRPILMTTFTTICGLLPMALGDAALLGVPYAPLGRAMIGGLLASTFLTLLLVPLFYIFFDDLRALWHRLLTAALTRNRSDALKPT